MNIITVTDRKFLSQQRNGTDFLTNPTTDFSDVYKVNSIEKTKLIQTVQVSTIEEASSTSQFEAVTVGTQIKIIHPFTNWITAGFGVNNTVRIENSSDGSFINETIELVNGLDMYLSDSGFFAALGTTDGDASPFYVFKVTTVPTSLTYKFDTISNSVMVAPFLSLLTDEPLVYAGDGINGTLTDLPFLSSNASKVGTAQAKFNSSSGVGSYVHEFTIEHTFQNIYFIESWTGNYQNETIPYQYQALNSYRYVSEMNFSTNVNDPNQGKIFLDDFQSGSVGLYNQNFNAGAVHYHLDSIALTVGGSPVSNIDVDATTTVTIEISKDNGAFSATELAGLYCSKLPSESAYNVLANTVTENFVFDSVFNAIGSPALDGDYIKGCLVTLSGANLSITFRLEYDSAQKDLISNGDPYFIGVGVEDVSISNYLSDRVTVWATVGSYVKTPDVPGLVGRPQINIYNSAQSLSLSIPTSNFDTWVNTLQFVHGTFDITKFTTGQQTKLKNFKVQIIAGTVETNYFVIQEYVFQINPVAPFLTIGGVNFDLIDIVEQNTLGIPSAEPFNKATLSAAPGALLATEQAFEFSVGFELSWRDWAQLTTVAPVAPEFYDALLDFDGFNGNMSNYSSVNGYEIYVVAVAEINSSGTDTIYNIMSDMCAVSDFDVDVVAGWTATTEFFDEAGDPTNNIFIGQDITVVVTMDNPGTLTSLPVTGAEIVVEVSGSTGRDYRLHSQKDWSETANFLKGPSGGDYVVHTQAAAPNKEILTCVLKKEKISISNNYNFYGHLNLNS